MRFLSSVYEQQGGSRYLYRLFNRGSSGAGDQVPEGVITLTHVLADLPPLAHNEDTGFGTTI